MTTHLSEVLDEAKLAEEIAGGWVTERKHPEFPELSIFNYSDKTQYANHWNDVTMVTRGLIVNNETRAVLARPFRKFFNYGDEANTGQLDPDAELYGYSNKYDGSLGIGYVRPDGVPAIATRGSFSSEQAIHASALLLTDAYSDLGYDIREGSGHQTVLFEIIYPENRIVLDYGDRDELVWLGDSDVETGEVSMKSDGRATLRELVASTRPNSEGWVAWIDPFTAVKIKQDDYLALHRAISSMTPKEVWRQMQAGTFEGFAAGLPDEFHGWADEEFNKINERFVDTCFKVNGDYLALHENKLQAAPRKDQAKWIQANVDRELQGLVFSMLDGRDITSAIWKMIEPKGTPSV